MTALTLTITDSGRAALINAEHTGLAPVTIAEVGVSASAVDAAPSATALPGEIKRLTTFSGAAIAADTLHITIRDDSTASYALRSFALYLNDGTLFALYGQSAPVMQKSANAMLLLSVDVTLVQVAATAITFGDANFMRGLEPVYDFLRSSARNARWMNWELVLSLRSQLFHNRLFFPAKRSCARRSSAWA